MKRIYIETIDLLSLLSPSRFHFNGLLENGEKKFTMTSAVISNYIRTSTMILFVNRYMINIERILCSS